MENFSEQLVNTIEQAILRDINKQELVSVNYTDKIHIPSSLIQEVYSRIDMERVKQNLVAKLETELADRVFNKIVAEFATDVKQILSNKEIREDVRSYVRNTVREMSKGITDDNANTK